ncbi:enoyl-CoA hydratase/isomerase family protein [Frankia sp. AgW1.1]|nr:enoyl-CoA hydratase/isomerase family protein [Frankia sp. AgW1.1]MBL7619278.1 enoyl-CoA hydratase/isomerase family protein [Frankia sp. AgB1.8]
MEAGPPRPEVRIDRDGPLAVVTVDRPGTRNAFGPDTLHHVASVIRHATDDGIRALVLTGAGEVSFSSGMDLKALASAPREQLSAAVEAFDAAMDAAERPPLIAAVNGAATGGGFEIALRCDLVVAADHATFGLPEVRRGIVPGGRGTLLPSRIPIAVALEIGIVGEPISAARAYELGLVNRVVSAPELLDVARDLGRRIAANGPLAVARTRALMWTAATESAALAWEETRRVRDDPGLAREMREGVTAFLEKRSPRW